MKKILIAVLAVAVLFGFAACNDGSSSTTSGVIAGATVTGGGEKVYIPGETVDLSDYTFSLTMADGTTQPADASDFVFNSLVVPCLDDGKEPATAFTAGTVIISGSYKGMTDAVVGLKVNVAAVQGITVTGELETKEYFAAVDGSDKTVTDGQLKLNGLKVTASYLDKDGNKGEREVTLDNENLNASLEGWSVSGNASEKKDLTIKFGTISNVAEQKLTDAITLKPNRVQSVALKATEGYTLYAGTQVADKKLAYTATPVTKAGVYVEATYENGEVAVLDGSDVKFAKTKDAAEASTVTGTSSDANAISKLSPATTEENTLYAYYAGTSVVSGLERNLQLALNVVSNAETKLKVEVASADAFKVGALGNYTNNEAGFKALLKVSIVYADGSVASTALSADDYTVVTPTSENRDLSKVVEGDVIPVSVTATRTGNITLEGSAELTVAGAN